MWTLQDAKNKFSSVVDAALAGAPQEVSRRGKPAVVVLSADDRPDTVMSAIDAGAVGFIPKTARSQDMREALQTVLSGGVYLPSLPPAANDSGFAVLDDEADVDAMGLSARQLDVLRLLVEGKTNKDICRSLGLSESTVKTHLAAIFRKLGVRTRTQAALLLQQLESIPAN